MALTISFPFIVLLTLGFAAHVRCDFIHYTTYKSFSTALSECGEYFEVDNATLDQYICNGYPSTPEVKQLIHCALVNIGAWNDNIGVRKNVIAYFFKPNEHDTEYEERTQCCLDQIYGCDQNHLAYETFSCYYRLYGSVVKDDVFVPNEQLELFQLLTFLKLVLNIPPEKVKQFAQGDYLEDPLFKQALFIGALRLGVYSWDNGYLLDAGYAQSNISELISPCTRQCVADAAAEYCHLDKQEQVYLIYIKCLRSLVDPLLLPTLKLFSDGKVCGILPFY